MGMVLSVLNLATKCMLLLALAALQAVIVFPVSTAGVIVLSAAASMVFWKERYGARGILGLVLAVMAIVLINLGR